MPVTPELRLTAERLKRASRQAFEFPSPTSSFWKSQVDTRLPTSGKNQTLTCSSKELKLFLAEEEIRATEQKFVGRCDFPCFGGSLCLPLA